MFGIHFVVPVSLIVLSLPLILEMVPRNRFYGFRTEQTLSSDDVWYPANRVAGSALAVAGGVWLAAALLASRLASSPSRAQVVLVIGLSSLAVAIAVSFLYVRRL